MFRAAIFRPAFLVALLLLVLTTERGLAAEAAIGEVSQLQERAKLERDGTVREILPGDKIHAVDVIRTNAKGRVEIRLAGGALITIGPQSRVRLGDVVQRDEGLVSAVINLLRGVIRVALNPDPGRKSFEIVTRTALVSVRSTEWIVDLDGNDKTAVFVIRGRVAAKGRLPTNQGDVILQAGEGADISISAIKGPKIWGQKRIDALVKRVSF